MLGSSGSYPFSGNPASGYLVRSIGTNVLLDVGPGTFMALTEHLDPEALGAVVVSHVHPDHCTDLFGLYSYLYRHVGGSTSVPVFVPTGAVEIFTGFMRAADPDHPFLRVLDFRIIGAGMEAEVGDVVMKFGRMSHPVPTVGVRLESGSRVLTYSADTGPGGDLRALAQGADVLLCEAGLTGERDDETFPFHLTAAEAGEVAAAAGVSRLIVTHLPPSLDVQSSLAQARSTFAGDLAWAEPGLVTTI